jgi:O-antigen ligase
MLRFLLALPLLFLPNALHFSGAPLLVGLNLSNLALLLLMVAIPLFAHEGAPRLPGFGRLGPALLWLFLAYAMAFVIAVSRSSGTLLEDLTVLKTAVFYPMFYFVYRNCRADLRQTRQLIVLALVVAMVAGIEAVHEAVSAGMFGAYVEQNRASGPFGVNALTANLAGYFYASFLPVFIAGALFLKGRPRLRMAAIIGAGILGLAVLVTFSRQAYAISLLCLLLLALRRNLAAALVIGVLMLAATTALPESVTERVAETRQDTGAGTTELDQSTASRFDIWTGALRMWTDHPEGVGLNRFKEHIGDYTSYSGYDAHNYFVLMLAEAGPLGLAALLFLLWRLWSMARGVQRGAAPGDSEQRALGTGFSLLVIAMALGNSFGSFLLQGLAMGSLWAFIGLVERYGALKAAERENPAPVPQPRPALVPGRFPLVERARRASGQGPVGDAS